MHSPAAVSKWFRVLPEGGASRAADLGATRNLRAIAVRAAALTLDLVRDESGQDLIEYALCSALIALGAVASIKPIAGKLATLFTSVSTALTSAV